jgi:hypothetical protein
LIARHCDGLVHRRRKRLSFAHGCHRAVPGFEVHDQFSDLFVFERFAK